LTHYQGNTAIPADLLPHRTSAEGKALLPTNATKAVVAVGSVFSPFQVTHYLLDKALIIDEDTLYELSLKLEPRLPA
ncbi:hypothetical protein CIB84_001563, partial [Bambusicola thoracicus]